MMRGHREPSREPREALDEATRRIERTLEEALAVAPPAELSERIYQATAEPFVIQGLDADGERSVERADGAGGSAEGLADDLQRSLEVTPPSDLAELVHQATDEPFRRHAAARRVPGVDRGRPTVIGQLGWLGGGAVAAAVLVLVGAGVWLSDQPGPSGAGKIVTGPGPSPVEQPGSPAGPQGGPTGAELAAQIERSLRAPVDPIDTRIMALSAEVDQLAQAVEFDGSGDPILDATGRELERVYMLEGQMNAF